MERHKKHTAWGLIIVAFLGFVAIVFDKRLEIIEFLKIYEIYVSESIKTVLLILMSVCLIRILRKIIEYL